MCIDLCQFIGDQGFYGVIHHVENVFLLILNAYIKFFNLVYSDVKILSSCFFPFFVYLIFIILENPFILLPPFNSILLISQLFYCYRTELNSKMEKHNSVIIIGAGLAGLTAADQILKTDPQASITILEAMALPGGRTRSVEINGANFDLGAQWIGQTQKFVEELAKRAGLYLMEQHYSGNKIVQFGKQIKIYETELPKDLSEIQLTHMRIVMEMLDTLAKTVPLDCPRNCQHAIEWDSMTAHTWIEQHVIFDKVKRFIELLLRSFIGCETNEISFLFFLSYLHQNKGIFNMMNTDGGLQAKKFVKGSQSLSFFLQQQINKKGGKIYYNSFVSKVIQDKEGVTVRTRTGQQYKSKYLIIAMPPPAVRNIQFQPQLSRQRKLICQRFNMGAFSKIIILYDKQYWYQNGYSGELLSDCHDGPVLNAYDDTKPKQNGQMQPAIVILCAASVDEQWTRVQEQCKRTAVKKLAAYYKCPEMLSPIAIEMKVWNDEQSLGGAPTAYLPPGVLTKIHNIREPQGRIHWAGTQTALASQGYMDGAIESGIRVSKQIIKRFNEVQIPVSKVLPPTSKWYSQIALYKSRAWYSKL